MKEGNKLRCDHCGEWQPRGNMVTVPEELYYLLDCDNEYGICWTKCAENKKHDLEYWRNWILNKKKQQTK